MTKNIQPQGKDVRAEATDGIITDPVRGKPLQDSCAMCIDDSRPVPAGTYVGAVRLIAMLGKGDQFRSKGKPDGLARSAWQWVVRIEDGASVTLATLTHLVTLDDSAGSYVRGLAAALTGNETLMSPPAECNADFMIGRSAMIEVIRVPSGTGRFLPNVARAWVLPSGTSPIVLTDACVWKPSGKAVLPLHAPNWVRNYANSAVAQYWNAKHAKG